MSTIKVTDKKKFREMWLDDEITTKEIADYFKIGRGYVFLKRKNLGLPPKGTRGFGMTERMRVKGEQSEEKVLIFLKEKGGFCLLQLLVKWRSAIARLEHEKRIFIVTFQFKRGTGVNVMRKKYNLIFNEAYPHKSYVCNSRTAMIRLMSRALKKPTTEHLQKTVTAFLRNYLTDAERLAVLWKLGIRKFGRTQVKSSIQIDGVIKPTGRKLEQIYTDSNKNKSSGWKYDHRQSHDIRLRRLWINPFYSQEWGSFWATIPNFFC